MCQTSGCIQPCPSTAVIPAPPASVIVREAADKPENFPLVALACATRTTIASYHESPLPGISKTPYAYNHHGAAWRIIIPIQVPTDILEPTLSSLRYMIKYSTTFDDGNSTVQADIILSTESLDGGVAKAGDDEYALKGLYQPAKSGYAPRIVNENTGVSLLTVSSVKCNGGGAQWSHFVDSHELHPDIRLVDPSSHLYLVFNVAEYPTKDTERFLAVEATASWFEDVEARKVQEEAEKKAKEAAAKNAKEEADRLAREEAEKAKKADDELKNKINDEVGRRVAEAERKIQAEANQRIADAEMKIRAEVNQRIAEAESKLRAEADMKEKAAAARMNAPEVADQAMQNLIEAATKKYNVACTSGYTWNKTVDGYECGGKGHRLTWAQLGL